MPFSILSNLKKKICRKFEIFLLDISWRKNRNFFQKKKIFFFKVPQNHEKITLNNFGEIYFS